MSSLPSVPLHLFQVLEQEFEALHGAFDKQAPLDVSLPEPGKPNQFLPVKAISSWDFDSTHILKASALAQELLGSGSHSHKAAARSWSTTTDWTRKNLIDYLRPTFDQNVLNNLATLRADDKPSAKDLESITSTLNKLLDTNLYSDDRFAYQWLSPPSRSVVMSAKSEQLQGQDRKHLNRLLLEDAFPDALAKVNDIRLAAIYQRIHAVKPSAISLSGGGIRSGTFGLGLLQGLARHQLLDKFQYLSTVSGGGYIGSWLAAWIHRHPRGLAGVTTELANITPASKIDPDPDPIRYLRRYSNFITPKVGLLTADTWTFIAIYLRNLFLNWVVFIPLLLAVLVLPRLVVAITLAQPEKTNELLFTLSALGMHLPVLGRHIFLIAGFLLGSWSLAYIIFNRPRVREELRQNSRFWRSRANQRNFLVYCLVPLTLSAFTLTTYWAWTRERGAKDIPAFLIFGVAFSGLAWIISVLVMRRWKPKNLKNNGVLEPIVLLLSGLAGGAILWIIAQVREPVIGYALNKNSEDAFKWTVWSITGDLTWTHWTTELYACFAVPIFMLAFLLAATFFVGIMSTSSRVDDEDREWWARLGAWCLIVILAWAVASILVILGPIAMLNGPSWLAAIGGLSGLLAVLLGRSSKTAAKQGKESNGKGAKSVLGSLGSSLLPLLAMIFIAVFLVALSLATTGILQGLALGVNALHFKAGDLIDLIFSNAKEWLTNVPEASSPDYIGYEGFKDYVNYIHSGVHYQDPLVGAKVVHMNVLHHSSVWFVSGLGIALFGFGLGVSRLVNLNLFSLHGGYRNRLIRAFLGASRPDHQRKPNPFTGFDAADNLSIHELRPGLLDEDDFVDPSGLAAALNDTSNAMSKYLVDNGLLENVRRITSRSSASPRLVAALRKDLNTAIEDKNLHTQKFATALLNGNKPKAPVKPATVDNQATQPSATDIQLNRRALELAYPNMLRPQATSIEYKLMPVINTTLNLVGGENLAWQQRKAEPFSVSPLHSGCFRLGYRDSRYYGGHDTGGISIGTAATISGAAASSNMGYYTTSPVLSLVLTLFNVRLGWWLGNPGPAGKDTYDLRAPKYSVAPVIYEALGLTDDRNKYVYLTDGGHFENLALYEMVLRRCHFIIVSDGAADEHYKFGDLGNAVRKVRIDLGIPIEFTAMPIFAPDPDKPKKGTYWAIGRINYSCIDGNGAKDGLLLYVKPAVYGVEPQDVLEYKRSHSSFPHQTTADQFFDEPQFESYRALGSYIADQFCAGSTGNVLKAIEQALTVLQAKKGNEDPLDSGLEWVKDWLEIKDDDSSKP